MENSIIQIRSRLKNNANKETREKEQHFFKEKIITYGVKTPLVDKISKEIFKNSNLRTKTEVFKVCESLFQSGILEESIVACKWSYYMRKQYELSDFKVFERWISNHVSNWATCDTLCNHSVGELIEMYPACLSEIKKMAKSENRWSRRAAAVSLIIPARKGLFLQDVLEIADLLLLDKDDLVQKGYGWMLKVASQKHQQAVFEYVVANKTLMPRTALRYAIEKMPKDMKAVAMKKLK